MRETLQNQSISAPKKILVTGANGFIGQALCELMRKQGMSFRTVVRASGAGSSGPDSVTVGAIDGDTDWSRALPDIDVVIHLAARVHVMRDIASDPLAEFRRVNVAGSLNLARQAAASGVRRFIYISSIKVNGEETQLDKPYTDEDQPAPVDPYGISKREAEDALRRLSAGSGMEVVIIRPPLVYGPGVEGNFLSMMRWLDKGIPLPLAAINNKRSLVAVDNLVDLIITCIEHPAAANQIFMAGDGEDMSTTQLLRRTAAALGKSARLWPAPVPVLSVCAGLLGKGAAIRRLCTSLQVDIARTRQVLGWTPPITVEQALRKTASRYLKGRK